MKPSTGIAWVLAALGTASIATTTVTAQTPAEMAQTAAYAAAHQNKDGGFAAKVGQPSSLGTTHSALKILKYVGGSVPDVLACVDYVNSCRVKGGGFSQTPGGKPDVVTTALGLMAAAELKIHDPEMIREAVAYFGKNARTFEEVRMSAAGMESTGLYSTDTPRWHRQLEGMRNGEGSFGSGAAVPFTTGGVAAAILRLGLPLEHRDAIVRAIKNGQRPEGGWSKDDGPPDLSSSYRIMRAMYMMHEAPDLDRLLGYVARCRKPDGSYSNVPGGEGNLGGTYLGAVITYWSRQLMGLPAVVETAGFTPIVQGDSLDGWEGDKQLWSVKDGVLIGHSNGLNHNEFLATTRPYDNFVLSLNFHLADGQGNSGVQFRSVRVPGTEMSGYQADIGEGYWGALYDESRRNRVLVYPKADAVRGLHRTAWNHYTVRAMGDRITLSLNEVTSVPDYREPDSNIARDGLLAVQLHAGGSTEVKFRDVMIQRLPSPKAGEATNPGFHVRTLESGPDRRTLYGLRTRGLRRHQDVPGDPVPPRLRRAGRRRGDVVAGGARPGDPGPAGRHPGHRDLPAGPSDLGGRLARCPCRARGPRRGDARLQGRSEAGGPHRAVDGRPRELGDGRGPRRSVRRRRPDLRAGRRRARPAGSRAFPSGPSAATPTATRPCSTSARWSRRSGRRRPGPAHRVSRRRPQ